ncbi:MAG: MFS transporter [Ktedonobacteraceae bacterium]
MEFSTTSIDAKDTEKSSLSALGLTAICFGFFMVILDTSIVNVALPAIQLDLHGSLRGLQWVVNGYTLVFASLLLSAGTLGDRWGHKRAFLIGFLLFTLGSLLCSIVPSLATLIVARILQGVGPALLVPASLSLITHGFSDPGERARAIGIWGGSSGIGLASGPVVGGLLVETLGWRSIFLLNIPIGILAIVLTLRFVTETPRSTRQKLDLWGQLCAILMLATLTYALIEGRQEGWFSPQIISVLLVCLVSLIAFLLIEARHSNPMLPLRLFALPTFSAATIVGSVINFGFYGVLFVLSLFFQDIQHYSAVLTGVAFLPITIATGLNSLLSGRVTARFGSRRPMLFGLAGSCLGIILLLLYIVQGSGIVYLIAGEIITGIGCGMSIPAMTTAILEVVPRTQVGLASALLNASRQVGGVLGVAILGSLLGSLSNTGAFLAGMRAALVLVALLFLLGCALTLAFVQRQKSA